MRTLLICCFCFLTTALIGQVVNTEKLRLSQNDNSLSGDVDLNFGLARNKAGQTLSFGTQVRTDFTQKNNKYILLGGYGLTQFRNVNVDGSVPSNFRNFGFAHLRYNKTFNERLTWEVFAQAQYNEIQEIDSRVLLGTGPRFVIGQTDSSHLFLGALYMYEYEKNSVEGVDDMDIAFEDIIFERNHRLSTYLSGGFSKGGYLTFNHVTYFQPRLDDWSDFRISSETTLGIKLGRKIFLNTYFQLIYDAAPPETVPRTMYNLRNGLGLEF